MTLSSGTVFVTVGNELRPFSRMSALVRQFANENPDLMFHYQHGHSPPVQDLGNVESCRFMKRAEFESLVTEAEDLICHAGAGTLITACLAGRRPIVVPRLASLNEHLNDHQLDIFKKFIDVGYIRSLEDSQLSASESRMKFEEQGGKLLNSIYEKVTIYLK